MRCCRDPQESCSAQIHAEFHSASVPPEETVRGYFLHPDLLESTIESFQALQSQLLSLHAPILLRTTERLAISSAEVL